MRALLRRNQLVPPKCPCFLTRLVCLLIRRQLLAFSRELEAARQYGKPLPGRRGIRFLSSGALHDARPTTCFPIAFHPMNVEAPFESRPNLANGRMVDGDIEAQRKLASLLADEGATEMEVEPDVEEASSWSLRDCASDEVTASQLAQAHLEIGHLLMKGANYDRAAHHFSLASGTYHEAAELQSVCEEQAEKHWRWRQHHS